MFLYDKSHKKSDQHAIPFAMEKKLIDFCWLSQG